MFRRFLPLVITSLTLAASCFRDPGIADGSKLRCEDDDNCLAGYRCTRTADSPTSELGFCVRADATTTDAAATDVAGNEAAVASDGRTGVDEAGAATAIDTASRIDSPADQGRPSTDTEDAPVPPNDGPPFASDGPSPDTALPAPDATDAPATGTGGVAGTGGSAGTGGKLGTGGSAGAGGRTGSGGTGAGGLAGTGGASTTGGTPGTGGSPGTGGTPGTGGAGTGGTPGSGGATIPKRPCDIYQSASTPCVAAHSTVRALYGTYGGPLYQVQRASDNTTRDVPVDGPGGLVDIAVQDSFCFGTTCAIPIIYDQSPNENHLRVTWWAYWLQNGGKPANANSGQIKVGGRTAHGIYVTAFSGDVAYRTGTPLAGTASVTKGSATVTFTNPQTIPANSPLFFAANTLDCPPDSWPSNCNIKPHWTTASINNSTTVTLQAAYDGTSSAATAVWNHATKGVAIGDEPEAMYMVVDGMRYSQYCCFSYGNAQLSGWDEGNATMEAVSWGAVTQFGQSGGGSGPWVAADLENGIYEGYENGSVKVPSNTSVTGFPFVTAMLKGLSANDCPSGLTTSGCFALKAGNATSGNLEWKWNANTQTYGARPPNYSPQDKRGAIILGTGGDGSKGGTGTFFEGAITRGAPPDSADDAVQADIVAAGYGI